MTSREYEKMFDKWLVTSETRRSTPEADSVSVGSALSRYSAQEKGEDVNLNRKLVGGQHITMTKSLKSVYDSIPKVQAQIRKINQSSLSGQEKAQAKSMLKAQIVKNHIQAQESEIMEIVKSVDSSKKLHLEKKANRSSLHHLKSESEAKMEIALMSDSEFEKLSTNPEGLNEFEMYEVIKRLENSNDENKQFLISQVRKSAEKNNVLEPWLDINKNALEKMENIVGLNAGEGGFFAGDKFSSCQILSVFDFDEKESAQDLMQRYVNGDDTAEVQLRSVAPELVAEASLRKSLVHSSASPGSSEDLQVR